MADVLLGTDICQISRIEAAVKKYGLKFLNKTFTPYEIKYSQQSKRSFYERLSVRFAVKEALSKALGVGINKLGWSEGINWKDVELTRNDMGQVSIKLSGKARELAQASSVKEWKVSVSHMGDYATATVIGIVD